MWCLVAVYPMGGTGTAREYEDEWLTGRGPDPTLPLATVNLVKVLLTTKLLADFEPIHYAIWEVKPWHFADL